VYKVSNAFDMIEESVGCLVWAVLILAVLLVLTTLACCVALGYILTKVGV